MTLSFRILIFAILIFANESLAQLGCTDPQASNFDLSATINDGSCQYTTTNYTLTEITILPDLILETSGLAYFDEQLWTHNDGGNEDKIYQIDTITGEVLQTIIIANSENVDWEDMAQDATHLYLGDFGNNPGNRTDLKIYKFPKSQLANGIATAEVIEFSYEDQTDFTLAPNNNDYDCEAFFFYNDSLHLFSKNWVDQKTRHYVIPSQSGIYTAEMREVMNTQGLVTGADISEDGVVALIGYNPSGVNLMWLCFDFQGTDFFSGNKRKISLGLALNNSQTEAIVFREDGYGYISSEKFASLDSKLLSFQTSQWTTNDVTSIEELQKEEIFELFPNPSFGDVNILLEEKGFYAITLHNAHGEILKATQQHFFSGETLKWNLFNTPSGMYFLKIKKGNRLWVKRFILKK